MTKKQHNKIIVILSEIVFAILLLVPFLFVVGWYILFYGGSLALLSVFKVGLTLLALTTLLFWVVMTIYSIHELR